MRPNSRKSGQSTRKLLLATEFILVFFGLPLTYYFHIMPIPKFAVLLSLAFFSVLWLAKKKTGKHSLYNNQTGTFNKILRIALRTVFVCFLLILLTLLINPETLFYLPRNDFTLWITTAFTYSIFSALPQEILYRSFFFFRYGSLFKNHQLALLINVVSFSFLHIIYGNIVAVLLTLCGGYFFCTSYQNTRSLLLATIEHALYGYIVFTVGLDSFFVV